MHPIIENHLEDIVELCRQFGVERLEAFGSVTTPTFDPMRSDIDFIVMYPASYDYGAWLGRVQDLEAALAKILGRDVDLVMSHALRKPQFAAEAAKTRIVIYDATMQARSQTLLEGMDGDIRGE